MRTMNVTDARSGLYNLLKEVVESHEPVEIKGKTGSALLVAEEDWRAIQETLHLLSVPGMRESVQEGLRTPLDECSQEPPW